LCDGNISTTARSSISRVCSSSSLARRYAVSSATCVAPTSFEWMPWLSATMALPERISDAASAGAIWRGSASRMLSRRISSRRAMFASDVIVTIRNGRPLVVFPTSSTFTRGDAASRRRK
jgi:hypothetical protein